MGRAGGACAGHRRDVVLRALLGHEPLSHPLRVRPRRRAPRVRAAPPGERAAPHPARRGRGRGGLPLSLGLGSSILSDDQFLAVASLATTALYVSYVIPIALGAVSRHRGVWRRFGPWHLGRFGVFVAWGAVVWAVVVLATAALPHGGAYLGLLIAVGVGLAIFYAAFVRGRFHGPADRPPLE